MFCGKCGKEITDPNGICSNCGNVQVIDKSRFPENYNNQPREDYNNPNYYDGQPQNNYNANPYNQQYGGYDAGFESNYVGPGGDGYYVNENQNYDGYDDAIYDEFNQNYSGEYEEGYYDNYNDNYNANYSDGYEDGYYDDNSQYNGGFRRKSGVFKPLIAALCGAAGLIAIVVVCYNVFFSGPDQVAKDWVSAVNNGDIDTIYDYLPDEYKVIPKGEVKADLFGEFDKAEVEYNGREKEEERDELGDKIKTDGTVYYYNVGPETIQVFKQDGEWRVRY